jgi:hypothetical protein
MSSSQIPEEAPDQDNVEALFAELNSTPSLNEQHLLRAYDELNGRFAHWDDPDHPQYGQVRPYFPDVDTEMKRLEDEYLTIRREQRITGDEQAAAGIQLYNILFKLAAADLYLEHGVRPTFPQVWADVVRIRRLLDSTR